MWIVGFTFDLPPPLEPESSWLRSSPSVANSLQEEVGEEPLDDPSFMWRWVVLGISSTGFSTLFASCSTEF